MMKRLNKKEWKDTSVSAYMFFASLGAYLGYLLAVNI